MKYFYLPLFCLLPFLGTAQELYFPPIDSEDWETLSLNDLNWCPEKVDSLIDFVEESNSKSFIILKDGKIVIEEYFDDHDAEALWYWASAGKSLMAMLMGMVQEDGLVDIENPTNTYLGEGWTNCSLEDEAAIKIRHQLSMASGLDDSIEPTGSTENCFEPECFECLAAPNTRWAYHNSAYRILQDVLESVTGQDKSLYTRTRLGNRIGMKGFWLDYIYFSKARDMARFGLLTLAQGNWDGDIVLADQNYYSDMVNPSQEVNPSYGYLWWLNGQDSYMLPGLQLSLNGNLIAEAPEDMFAALGKNDQKIYVVPSQNLVVVRQGNSAGPVVAAPSSFDNQLWAKITDLSCVTATKEMHSTGFKLFPNPAKDLVEIQSDIDFDQMQLFNVQGQLLKTMPAQQTFSVKGLPAGLYFVQLSSERYIRTQRLFVRH
jgi:CubicO group peptidase (beta-lactamase class C family)